MAEKIDFNETVKEFNESVKENVNFLVENSRKMMLAGLGAFALAQEEWTDLFNNLVERGTATKEKTQNVVSEQVENRQKEAKKAARRFEKEIDKQFETVLHWMNIPSKSDIEKLSRKVSTLNKKVNDLSKTA